MQSGFTHLEAMERYHQGLMTEAEKKDFANLLASDPGIQQEYEAYLLLIEGIQYEGDKALRQTIRTVESKLEAENFFNSNHHIKRNVTMQNQNFFRIGLIAAAATVVIVLGVLYFMPQQGDPAKAFATYYKPESTITGKVLDRMESQGFADTDKPATDSLAKAIQAYEAFEYQDAQAQLNSYLLVYPEDKIAHMYLGLTLLQQSEYAKAVSHIGPLAKDSEFEYYNTCRWYLALALSQFGDATSTSQAKEWLQKLIDDPDSGYEKEAKGLISLL